MYCAPSRVYLCTETNYCGPHGKSPNFQIRDRSLVSDFRFKLGLHGSVLAVLYSTVTTFAKQFSSLSTTNEGSMIYSQRKGVSWEVTESPFRIECQRNGYSCLKAL